MPGTSVTIYHNPRCSKSRAALALLQERGAQIEIIEYLKTPLNAAELAALLTKLKLKPLQLIRGSEEVFKTDYQGKELSDAEWIAVMAQHPILIERPIAVRDNRAVVGRPPEKVLELL